jgi:hypothetical protein
MRIEPKESTRPCPLVVTNLEDPLHIRDINGNEIWVSTSYGTLSLGVVGGGTYRVENGAIVQSNMSEPVTYQHGGKDE